MPGGRTAWVALLAEGVGRNFPARFKSGRPHHVALLAEGVGRNCFQRYFQPRLQVALLAEGVGRNQSHPAVDVRLNASPSSRRAWVEIVMKTFSSLSCRSRPPRGGRG